jgi:hypothetical protein
MIPASGPVAYDMMTRTPSRTQARPGSHLHGPVRSHVPGAGVGAGVRLSRRPAARPAGTRAAAVLPGPGRLGLGLRVGLGIRVIPIISPAPGPGAIGPVTDGLKPRLRAPSQAQPY